MNLLSGIQLFSGAVMVVVAVVVLVKRGLNHYPLPFMMFLLSNLCGLGAILIAAEQVTWLFDVGYMLLFLNFTMLPYAWYEMTTNWGIERGEYSKNTRMFRFLFLGAGAVMLIYLCVARWGMTPPQAVDFEFPYDSSTAWLVDLAGMKYFISIYMLLALVSGTYAIEKCYRSSIGLGREKIKRSFYPMIGYALSLLALLTVGLLYGKIASGIMTLNFLMAAIAAPPIARHYILFNPAYDGVILTRKGVYSSITVVVFGIYFIIIGAIGEVLIKYNLDDGLFFSMLVLIMMVLTFLIVFISQTIRSRLKSIAGSAQTPFRGKGLFEAEWKEFTEEVSVSMTLDSIYERTARLLHRLIKIDKCLFVIKEAAPSENYTLYSGDGIDRGISGDHLAGLCDWLHRNGHPVEAATLKYKAPHEYGQFEALQKTIPFEIFLLVPIIARLQLIGFWGIGRHASGRDLESEEIGFIEAAANPVALTILGARMTDELLVSREMESFHRFSSFVLHDLKNSVGMLSMLLQNAERNMNNPEFQKAALVTINKAVERQKKIISRLTAEKIDYKLSLEEVPLVRLVRETTERVRIDTVKSITLTVDVQDDEKVIVDPEKVGSVFDNLVMNAIEAMPEGGELIISSTNSDNADMLGISFRDTGSGMDQEFIATRLFKPFSSTKPYGLGIGMYQSREIIKAHKGRMEVMSSPGEGTEFIIYLPKGDS